MAVLFLGIVSILQLITVIILFRKSDYYSLAIMNSLFIAFIIFVIGVGLYMIEGGTF